MKKILLTTFVFGMISAPALAGHHEDMGHDGKMCKNHAAKMAEKMISKMDKNSDGMISIEEHEAYHGSKFFNTDKNNDRMLSLEEITDHIATKKDKWKKHYRDSTQDQSYND